MGRTVRDKGGRTRWLTFEVAHEGHLESFTPYVRDLDRAEVLALDPSGVEGNIRQSLHNQHASTWTMLEDDQPVAMFGIVPTTDTHTCAWFLSTGAMEHYPRGFMALSRLWLDRLAQEDGTLFNLVWDQNKRSLKWLKALGFHQGELLEDLGLHGENFYLMTYPCADS